MKYLTHFHHLKLGDFTYNKSHQVAYIGWEGARELANGWFPEGDLQVGFEDSWIALGYNVDTLDKMKKYDHLTIKPKQVIEDSEIDEFIKNLQEIYSVNEFKEELDDISNNTLKPFGLNNGAKIYQMSLFWLGTKLALTLQPLNI